MTHTHTHINKYSFIYLYIIIRQYITNHVHISSCELFSKDILKHIKRKLQKKKKTETETRREKKTLQKINYEVKFTVLHTSGEGLDICMVGVVVK